VTAWSKMWVCSRSLGVIAGSNPSGGMDVCLLCVLCAVRQKSLRRADHSSRGVLPSVACLSVIMKHRISGDMFGLIQPKHVARFVDDNKFSVVFRLN